MAAVESTSIGDPKLSPPSPITTPKASSKILVPVRVDSKNVNDATENSSPSSAGGDLLGLANYGSDGDGDDDYEDDGAWSRKLDGASHHLETAPRSYEHALKVSETVKEPLKVDANGDMQKERRISLPESSERKFHAKVPGVSETSEKTSSTSSERAGEIRQDAKFLRSSGTVVSEGGRIHESVNGDRTTSEKYHDGGANFLPSANRKPERNLDNRGLNKEIVSSSQWKDNENSKHGDKEKEKTCKIDKSSERGGDRNVKRGTTERDAHSKSTSRSEVIKDCKKEVLKDKGDKKKDYERRSERKRDRKEDYKKDGKEDQSEFARETLRHNFRSKSPVGRNAKDKSVSRCGNASSDESSDNSRKRYA